MCYFSGSSFGLNTFLPRHGYNIYRSVFMYIAMRPEPYLLELSLDNRCTVLHGQRIVSLRFARACVGCMPDRTPFNAINGNPGRLLDLHLAR